MGVKTGMGWLCKWGCKFWGRMNEVGGCLSLVMQVGGVGLYGCSVKGSWA